MMSSPDEEFLRCGFQEVEIQEKGLEPARRLRRRRHVIKGVAPISIALLLRPAPASAAPPVCYRLAFTAVLFAGAVALAVLEPDTARKIGDDLTP